MDESNKLDQIGRAMQAAWSRVKSAQSRMWGDWMTIGEGLLEGRRWAMQTAGTNKPEGKGYVTAFGEWLTRYGVHDMDKSDRAKLLQLMEERPAVEEWRATLTDHDRRMLNHPVIVWRKWTAATRVKKPKTEHGRAQATIEQLQARLTEMEEELQARPHQESKPQNLDDWSLLFSEKIYEAAHSVPEADRAELFQFLRKSIDGEAREATPETSTTKQETNECAFCGQDFGPFDGDETGPLDLCVSNYDDGIAICYECANDAYSVLLSSRRFAESRKREAKAKAKAEAKAAAEKPKAE